MSSSSATPQEVQQALESGKNLFRDIFRKADKNDDGSLSLEEFRGYFADGVLTDAEIESLFDHIDTDGDTTISTDELLDYFLEDFEKFQFLYAAFADTHSSIMKALNDTYTDYMSQSYNEQYRTRFYFREATRQIEHLFQPLSSGLSEQEKITLKKSGRYVSEEDETSTVITHKKTHGQKVAEKTGNTSLVSLEEQLERLSDMANTIQKQVVFPIPKVYVGADDDDDDDRQHTKLNTSKETSFDSISILVCWELSSVRTKSAFPKSLKHYMTYLKSTPECQFTSYNIPDEDNPTNYLVYELWEDEGALAYHYQSEAYKQFQRDLLDYLEYPAEINSTPVPTCWFVKN
eukprot:TRINITY_DN5590_c0_g1_i2.p1 TRINITY_DN5590_c0_g1~~TRINITY_DN5590_c0_g1_i2.p1  ORF type:complete len:347 (+),score=116.57 TRINITY_DN5590_c0_g1_i2:724-1764(+)